MGCEQLKPDADGTKVIEHPSNLTNKPQPPWGQQVARQLSSFSSCSTGSSSAEAKSVVNHAGRLRRNSTRRWSLTSLQTPRLTHTKKQKRRSTWILTGGEDSRVQGFINKSAEFVLSRAFERIIAIIIFANAAMDAVRVQESAVNLDIRTPRAYKVLEGVFNTIYVIEFSLRCMLVGPLEFCIKSKERAWNLFDAICITSSTLGFVLSNFVDGADANFPALLQMTSLMRLFRVFRAVRYLPPLRVIVSAIAHMMEGLFWAIVLMLLIMIVMSMALTEGAVDRLAMLEASHGFVPSSADSLQNSFGSLTLTSYTLFLSVTGGSNWNDAADVLQDMHWIFFAMLVLFIVFWIFVFVNAINVKVVESAFKAVERERDELVQSQLHDRDTYIQDFRQVFQSLGGDTSGGLSYEQLQQLVEDDRLHLYLEALNLNVTSACDIFLLLDQDGSGSITVEEFVNGCLHLRGSARNIDIAVLSRHLMSLSNKLVEFMQFVDDCFQYMAKE